MSAAIPVVALKDVLQYDAFEADQRGWIEERTRNWPARWKTDAMRRHAEMRTKAGTTAANQWLNDLTLQIASYKLDPTLDDEGLIALADTQATRISDVGGVIAARGPASVRKYAEGLCGRAGIEPPDADLDDAEALARMTCSQWWLRKLRGEQLRQRENVSIHLGYVGLGRDLYVSDESLAAELHKQRRSAAILEAIEAINDDGEIFTLDELATRGLANPTNRRYEMLTRAKGYEEIAVEYGHEGVAVTITTPRRMHARKVVETAGRRYSIDNPNYDGTSPKRANKYLVDLWARIRYALRRTGISIYGLRVTEPHHDGTPHWHMLLFVPAMQLDQLMAVIRRYALADSADEPGAVEHRTKFERIDRNKGSAIAYFAKYISKNIDGAGIDLDENGMPGHDSIKRVTAWAHIHGIRQFQFCGGPPVVIWRSLRRMDKRHLERKNTPPGMLEAYKAAQKTEDAKASYAGVIRACGGPMVSRKELRLTAVRSEEIALGRYGWGVRSKIAGIAHAELPGFVFPLVERHWQIVPKPGCFGHAHQSDMQTYGSAWGLRKGDSRAATAAARTPRIHVNNCATRAPQGFSGDNVVSFPLVGHYATGGPPCGLGLGGPSS